MRTILWVAACLWLAAAPARAQGNVATFSSYVDGKRFDFNVTRERLDRTPSWPESAEHPPLSPRKAMAVARAYLPALVEGADKWHRGDVTLTRVGAGEEKWVYLVGFSGNHPPGVTDGPVPTMRVVVLMDGLAVDPDVSEHKLSRRAAPPLRGAASARRTGTNASRERTKRLPGPV